MVFGEGDIAGLDIGSSAIKLVELKETRNGYQLKNIGEALLPPEAIVNKAIVDSSVIVETLSKLVKDLGVKTKDVAISISGSSVIIKKLSLPKMSEKELVEAIHWELEQNMHQSIAKVNYDFQILSGENHEGNMDVLIVAAKKDTTEDYIAVVNDAGLIPVVADVDVFALENMLDINYTATDEVIALINIGASVTNINILNGGVSIFARDITAGGKQFTEWIQKEFDIGFDEAERIKYSLGHTSVCAELDRLNRDFNDSICEEIGNAIDFFTIPSLKDTARKIILGGGSSKVPYIKERLEERIGVSVEILNPFKNILYEDSEFDPEYIHDISPKMGVAVGLALRRRGDK